MHRYGPCRLPDPAGHLIDRAKPLRFTFDGREYAGYAGDSVASALAANGVTVLSRSFKYHRPRGILSLAACDANTLVEINGVPNVLAERHALVDGDRVRAQNYSGSLRFDRGAWIGAFARFLTVGFYYRAFFRPKGAWRFWEPHIRRLAGLGRVDLNAHHGYYDKAYLFADVAVVGGGATGLNAAAAALDIGKRVVLVDHGPVLGGALNYARLDAAGARAMQTRKELLSHLAQRPNLTVLTHASCEGLFAENWLAIVHGRRLYKLRASKVVLATGALEQPAVFRNNDLPGIMLGSAAQRLIRMYGVRPGSRAVVLTANDFGYGVALDLAEAGVNVEAVVDLRSHPADGELPSAALARKIRIEKGTTIAEALGRRHVRGIRIAQLRPDGTCGGDIAALNCDLVCMSVGFAPNLALAGQLGARLVYDPHTGMNRAEGLPQGVTVAGAANQVFPLDAALADGARGHSEDPDPGFDRRAADVTHHWPIFPHARGKEFVDLDEDLTIKDIADTIASGFDDIQLIKRYSTVGMGPSQGRHSAVNTVRLAARIQASAEADIGTATARPPYSGESFGVLAGRAFEPVRRSAMHYRHVEAGAQMMPAGTWLRPAYYGSKATAADAIAAEAAAVHAKAGLIDVSTLGKIEVRGPDAAEFLNCIYFTPHRKQPVGRARYGMMTDAAGTITDDGIICRLADTHYFVTTTTSGLEAVLRSMYWWNAQWQLDVDLANVTSAYAAVNLAGPESRAILSALCRGIDLDTAAFPYMGVRSGYVADVPARVLRVGFVGELGYEIHVPSGCGEYVWDCIQHVGRPRGLQPFGVEAQRVLRLEKGHLIVGQDTDGLTNPLEIGMGEGGASKAFFIGAAALAVHRERGIRRKLAGFRIDDRHHMPKECHLVIDDDEIVGRVTSCAPSAIAGGVIGLAYVRPEQAEPGRTITIRVDGGRLITAQVAALPFYDPGNKRLHA